MSNLEALLSLVLYPLQYCQPQTFQMPGQVSAPEMDSGWRGGVYNEILFAFWFEGAFSSFALQLEELKPPCSQLEAGIFAQCLELVGFKW